MSIAAPLPLFEALPKDLFSPLASQNREHYWLLLCMLYGRYFGADADLPPAIGWDRRELVASIVVLLDNDDPWALEADETASTPVNNRAANYLNQLIKSGWIFEEKAGGITVCSMPTNVVRFMETLHSFVDFTPNAVGAKMRSIESALQRAFDSQHPGDDLDEAANQAKVLVSNLGTMGMRIREVMRSLNADVSTADALKQIFGEYISKVYMSDYSDFASGDHPLARKASVLALANDLSIPEHMQRLTRWYADHRKGGNVEAAEAHLDRTLRKIKALNRLQDFIDRLETDLRRMNRRMLALIDYRLQSPSHLEKRLQRAVDGVKEAEVSTIAIPSGPGQMLSGELLYKPRKRLPPIPRTSDARRRQTPESEARMRLSRLAKEARRVQPSDIRHYLHRVMGDAVQMRGSQLPILSIRSALGLHHEPQAFFLYGKVEYWTRSMSVHVQPPYVGLPTRDIKGFRFTEQPVALLLVENKQSFHEFAAKAEHFPCAVVYTAGMPSPSWRQAMGLLLAALDPLVPIYHMGDIDLGGFRIAANIAKLVRAAGRELRPWLMDPSELAVIGYELEMTDENRNIPAMQRWCREAGWEAIADELAKTPGSVEQELIEARFPI